MKQGTRELNFDEGAANLEAMGVQSAPGMERAGTHNGQSGKTTGVGDVYKESHGDIYQKKKNSGSKQQFNA